MKIQCDSVAPGGSGVESGRVSGCLHPFSLRFTGPARDLEGAYLADLFERSLLMQRVTAFVAVALFLVFGLFESHLLGDQAETVLWLRYAVFTPVGVAYVILSNTKVFRKIVQPASSVIALTGIGVLIAMSTVASSSLQRSYFIGMMLVLMVVYSLRGMRFLWAAATCWLGVALYGIFALTLIRISPECLLENAFSLGFSMTSWISRRSRPVSSSWKSVPSASLL